jgi:hypothetical protein
MMNMSRFTAHRLDCPGIPFVVDQKASDLSSGNSHVSRSHPEFEGKTGFGLDIPSVHVVIAIHEDSFIAMLRG